MEVPFRAVRTRRCHPERPNFQNPVCFVIFERFSFILIAQPDGSWGHATTDSGGKCNHSKPLDVSFVIFNQTPAHRRLSRTRAGCTIGVCGQSLRPSLAPTTPDDLLLIFSCIDSARWPRHFSPHSGGPTTLRVYVRGYEI